MADSGGSEEEVNHVAEEKRYQRAGHPNMTVGKARGSVCLLQYNLPILVQRVRDQGEGKEVRLKSYERLQELREGGERVL